MFDAPSGIVDFTGDGRADRLLSDLERHPHAFVFMSLMARNVKAETSTWAPYRLRERLGTFSFGRLAALPLTAVRKAMSDPTPLHRFPSRMAGVIHAAIQRIANEYDGDAANMWAGEPSSAEVVYRFLQFDGAGPKIANVATNCLARHFKVPFSDYYSIDIAADVHVRRVFKRLGLVSADAGLDEVIYRARSLHPEFPGLMDYPCWELGRNYCRERKPLCDGCYMSDLCPTAQEP